MKKILFVILFITLTSALIGCTNSKIPNCEIFNDIKDTAACDFITNPNDIYPISVSYISYTENGYNIITSSNDVVISKVLIALSKIRIIGETTKIDCNSYQYFIFTMIDGTSLGFCFNNMHLLQENDDKIAYYLKNDSALWNIDFYE